MENKSLSAPEFARITNNFYNSKGLDSDLNRIEIDMELANYLAANAGNVKDRKKVAFVWICLNPPYWEFAFNMIQGAKQFFLPGHDVDYFVWSDMPEKPQDAEKQIVDYFPKVGTTLEQAGGIEPVRKLAQIVGQIHKLSKVFPTESVEWPYPTLLRYHLFLQQEEILKDYDYIFYSDVDMHFANIIGDEILGNGLTSGVNPMYYLDKTMFPPYEPNPNSTAYIPRPGRVITENGQPRFQPIYFAGGFQGGKADQYLAAMKVMKQRIDEDMAKGYIAIWNEESHWNKYLFEHPENLIVLNPSYIYPDSLQNEYYIPRWGRNYQPKLVTLTKKFSLKPLSLEEQAQLTMMQKK